MASVWSELKRRNVVKVAVAYAIVGWLLFQLTDVLISLLALPEWVGRLVFLLVLIGLPLALIFAWAFELTPEGIKREKEVNRADSITQRTGQKLNHGIIGLLAIAVVFLVVDDFFLQSDTSPSGGPLNSIAVLPFANASAAEGNAEFLADGLHSEVITKLYLIGSLKVISKTSVLGYRDSPKNLREIGAELAVATILEGDVRQAGNRVQIDVKLINAETDEILWGDIYDRELTANNLFDVQREMATAIAGALQATLTPEEVARLNEIPTRNTRAYNLYLSGVDYLGRLGETYRRLALQQFERATEEDPGFALAYARLSMANQLLYINGRDRSSARREQILTNAQRALDLQGDLPEGHLAMGLFHYANADYDAALAELQIAARGMPNDPEINYFRGAIYRRSGQWELALAEFSRGAELDPRNGSFLLQIGSTLARTRHYAEAEQAFDRVLDVAPDLPNARSWEARIPWLRDGETESLKALAADPRIDDDAGGSAVWGWEAAIYERDLDLALRYLDEFPDVVLSTSNFRPISSFYGLTYHLFARPDLAAPYFEEARTQLEGLLEITPEDYRYHLALAEVLAGLGDDAGAVEMADQAMAMMSSGTDAVAGPLLQFQAVRHVFTIIGDEERVLLELDKLLANPGGVYSIEGILPDPRFDFIRDDPRFIALVEKYRRR